MRNKRIFAGFLCAILLAALLPGAANAASPAYGGASENTITLTDDTVTARYVSRGTSVPIVSGVTPVPEGAMVYLRFSEFDDVGGAFIPGSGNSLNMTGSYYSYTVPSSAPTRRRCPQR